VDVEHAVALVNAVNRALFNAGLVFDINARKRNNVSHDFSLSVTSLTVTCCASAPGAGVESREEHNHCTNDDRAVSPGVTKLISQNENFAARLLLGQPENRANKN
jgi:hypothetical protein